MYDQMVGLAKDIGVPSFAILLVIILYCIIKLIASPANLLDEFRLRKLQKIQRAINCQYLTDCERKYLELVEADEIFRWSTGIYVDRNLREYVIQFSRDWLISNNNLALIQGYLKRDKNKVLLEVSIWSGWGCLIFNTVLFFVLLVMAIFCMIFIALSWLYSDDIFLLILPTFYMVISMIISLVLYNDVKRLCILYHLKQNAKDAFAKL